MKIAAALSGGVDSAVAAAVLKEQGHELVGITALVWPDSRCCDAIALHDANLVAKALDIPYYTLDVIKEFQHDIVDAFVNEYRMGRTPNPCPLCNTKIRFGTMWEKILEIVPDCEAIITGHYTFIEKVGDRYTLRKGVDSNKDQSYMLYGLSQEQLARTLTPLGPFHKDEVREMADKYQLFVSKKPDSQDACFVSGDYKRFLQEYTQARIESGSQPKQEGDHQQSSGFTPGEIVDIEGNVLGQHNGIINYTIGQRKGLNLRRTGEENDPLYVIALDTKTNRVVVGSPEEGKSASCFVRDINWIQPQPESPINIGVRIRYNSSEVPAIITPNGETTARVEFVTPQTAVTPGQNAVFYDGDVVVGGGVIF